MKRVEIRGKLLTNLIFSSRAMSMVRFRITPRTRGMLKARIPDRHLLVREGDTNGRAISFLFAEFEGFEYFTVFIANMMKSSAGYDSTGSAVASIPSETHKELSTWLDPSLLGTDYDVSFIFDIEEVNKVHG